MSIHSSFSFSGISEYVCARKQCNLIFLLNTKHLELRAIFALTQPYIYVYISVALYQLNEEEKMNLNINKLIYVCVYEYNHTNQKVMIQCFYSKLESGNEKSEMIETKDDTFYIRY